MSPIEFCFHIKLTRNAELEDIVDGEYSIYPHIYDCFIVVDIENFTVEYWDFFESFYDDDISIYKDNIGTLFTAKCEEDGCFLLFSSRPVAR